MSDVADFAAWRRQRRVGDGDVDDMATEEAAVVSLPLPDDPAVARLDRAVERLHGLVSGALDGRGRLTPGVETELLAIMGELTVGLIPEAAERAERLATRLAQ